MAINIDDKGNVDGPGGNFEFSHIRDDSSPGSGDGTPVNTLVYGDFHQFFAKLIEQAGIVYNDLPENLTNGYQYLQAFDKLYGRKTRVQIGDWNMNTLFQITKPHGIIGLDLDKVIAVSAMIKNDAATSLVDLTSHSGGSITITSTEIILTRFVGGLFDNSLYEDTPFDRGFITIETES